MSPCSGWNRGCSLLSTHVASGHSCFPVLPRRCTHWGGFRATGAVRPEVPVFPSSSTVATSHSLSPCQGSPLLRAGPVFQKPPPNPMSESSCSFVLVAEMHEFTRGYITAYYRPRGLSHRSFCRCPRGGKTRSRHGLGCSVLGCWKATSSPLLTEPFPGVCAARPSLCLPRPDFLLP